MASKKLTAAAVLIAALLAPQSLRAQGLAGSADASSSLDLVVVTATNTEETKREVTTNLTVIDAAAIERSTATDLAGLLAQNGFQTYQTGAKATMYIRGLGDSSMSSELEGRVLILLNGHRTGSNDLTLRALGNVERVEVVRGPAALQYGPEVGGVVNVITKRGQEGFSAGAELGLGSFGRFDEKLNFSGARGGFDFAAAVSNTQREDYETGAGVKWLHNNYDRKFGLDLDAGYTFLENHRLGLHFNYALIDGNELPGSGWPDTSAYPNNYGNNDNYLHNTTLSYDGGTADGLFSWLAEYTFGQNDNDSYSFVTPEGSWSGPPYYPNRNSSYDSHMDFQQARAQGTFDNKTIALTAGFDYVDYDYETVSGSYDLTGRHTAGRPAGQRVKDTGVYLLGKLRLLEDSLIISAGGRYDSYKSTSPQADFKKDDNHFSPSIGLAWLPADFIKLRANYSEGFRLPSPSAVLGDGNWYEPNLDLKPEETKNFEIGADLSWRFIEANLTYFQTDHENKIISQPQVSGRYRYSNLGDKATLAGVEFGLSADLGQAWEHDFSLRPYVNVTWMTKRRNRDRNTFVPQDREVLPNVPKVSASYGLTFDHPGLGLTTTLNAAYIGKSWSMDQNFMVVTPTAYEYVDFGGFTVVDFSLTKTLWDLEDKGQVKLRAEVNNLFDEDYSYNLDYPMPGRNFYLGLVYAF